MKIVDKKAYYNFSVEKDFVAGLMLVGSEVKSLRNHDVDFSDSYVVMTKGELFIRGMRIAPYKNASFNNHAELRDRKLLLNKYEITRIAKKMDEKGMSVLPLEIFLSNQKFKLKIGICKGKRQYDKRQDIKSKDINRQQMRDLSDRG